MSFLVWGEEMSPARRSLVEKAFAAVGGGAQVGRDTDRELSELSKTIYG